MYSKRFCLVAVVFAALVVVLGTNGRYALAEPPVVERFFAQLTALEEAGRDWEGEGSRRVVAHRDGNTPNAIEFITPGGPYQDDDAIVRDAQGNIILDLRSTVWLRMPVVHVTSSGAEEVRHVYWLLEDLDGDGEIDSPEPGMTAPTGPDGNVATFVIIHITLAGSSDSYNPNKYYLSPAGSMKLCVAVGRFNK